MNEYTLRKAKKPTADPALEINDGAGRNIRLSHKGWKALLVSVIVIIALILLILAVSPEIRYIVLESLHALYDQTPLQK